jgi:long-subunit fatty acid transport protein
VIAGGIASPTLASSRFDDGGPQRYASLGVTGTQLVVVTAGAAYVLAPGLRVGATVQDLVSVLHLSIVASGCPGAMTCAADDRNYDLPMQIAQTDYLSPSGSLGVQYDASDAVTLGATLQAPMRVSATGSLAVTLPSAMTFAGMQITGDRATTSFRLPPTARAGVEYHQGAVHVEAALDVELWSFAGSGANAITIAPDSIKVGTFAMQPMRIARDYRTSIAASLGGEVHVGLAQVGAGIAYETAAAPTGDVSVLTVDAGKLLVGIGGGYDANGWQLGAAAGFATLADVNVTDPKVAQLAPLHDPAAPTFVNAGTYHAYYVLAGLRAARRF